jgi:hypothetical protein
MKRDAESLKDQLKSVQGGADQFSIQSVVWSDGLDPQTIRYQGEMDSHTKGTRNIYNATVLSESKFFYNGPGVALLMKILNSHIPQVDSINLTNSNTYGEDIISQGGTPTRIPSVEITQEVLMLV